MSTDKSWERPWSMEEIIENSDHWNLAGDVALLNTLKTFADNLLTKTNEINSNLQNLTNNLDETNLRLNIAQNEFQSLRNKQFIESRVYEDDESLPQQEKKIEKKNETDLSDEVRLAALKGLQVLNDYFDKVEVSVSDSDDDDIDLPNYILRPKDLYLQRPLPYVIGTDEWHKSPHVGLEDSSSDSETEKVSDKFSESDSDTDLPIIQHRSQIKGTSDTSSEFDFTQKTKNSDVYNSSENSSGNSVPAAPISGNNFAEELAAKLGNLEPEINKKPIQKPPKTNYDNIFFDEPPPLNEPKGLFSGGASLFDDDDNQSIQKRGLFEGSDSEDDIFAEKLPQTSKTPLFPEAPPSIAKTGPLNEEPPTLEERKKPIGGVSIFGGGSLFDKKLLKRRVSTDDEEEEENKQKKDDKKIDLFGDETVFDSNISKPPEDGAKLKVNLFDSDEEKSDNLGFFTKEKSPEKISLFDDDDDLFKDDLFSTNSTKKSFTSGLFDDISGDDLFSTENPKMNKSSNLVTIPDSTSINSNANHENIDEKPHPKPRLSLFDSPPPESDDLFKEADLFSKSTPTHHEEPINNIAENTPPVVAKSPPKPQFDVPTPPDVRLFDSSPPPDDDWDTKSSDNDDYNNDFGRVEGAKTLLFSEEPPILPETVAKPKPGKLQHNLKINVGALLPGSALPKLSERVRTGDDELSSAVSTTAPSVTSPTEPRPFVVPPTQTRPFVTSTSEPPITSLDETDRVEVLYSVTKDRAKVPLNRRPSTRRGRKAALENTSSDFKLEHEKNEIGGITKKQKSENLFEEKPSESEGLFGESPENDLFGIDSNDKITKKSIETDSISDTKVRLKMTDESLFGEFGKPTADDLFGKVDKVERLPTDDLFVAAQKSSIVFPEIKTKPYKFDSPPPLKKADNQSKSSIFDDEDDDIDDLFSTKKTFQEPKNKKSLFDDEENDEDDFFKSFSSANPRKTETKVAIEKKIPKMSSVKKLENTKPDDDPLSALLK